uniref:Uncharacterized protein n=1 Tax=Castor canadensis TaxID=51338 RepID=A0A8C0ZSC6_CASCN
MRYLVIIIYMTCIKILLVVPAPGSSSPLRQFSLAFLANSLRDLEESSGVFYGL